LIKAAFSERRLSIATRATVDAAFVWCGVASRDGATGYFGTGDEGKIVVLPLKAGGDDGVAAARRLTSLDAAVKLVERRTGKPLDLRVITAVDDFGEMPGGTIWPSGSLPDAVSQTPGSSSTASVTSPATKTSRSRVRPMNEPAKPRDSSRA